MSRTKKSVLLAFIAPVIMTTGCQMTPNSAPDFTMHNDAIKSTLQPLNEYYTGHALLGCENRLSIENYDEIMRSRISGTYGSPLANACVPISFDEFEPDAFYEDIISRAADPEAARELVERLKNSGYSDNMDSMHIHKIGLEDGTVAQIMRFNDGEEFQKLKSRWSNRKEMMALIDEYVFLHEIFHLSALNFDHSIPQGIREGMSDVSTVMVLSTKHQLTLNQTISLAKDVFHARRSDASNNPNRQAYDGSHFNNRLLTDMISYLEQLQDQGGELQRFASLKEANEYAIDMVLDLDSIQRNTFANGNIYWERGMDIPEGNNGQLASNGRRSFSDVLRISQDIMGCGHDHSHPSHQHHKQERIADKNKSDRENENTELSL